MSHLQIGSKIQLPIKQSKPNSVFELLSDDQNNQTFSTDKHNFKIEKKIQLICQTYEMYVYALFGRDSNIAKSPVDRNNIHLKEPVDRLQPDVVMRQIFNLPSFPNPDHPSVSIQKSLEPMELFELLQNSLSFQRDSLMDMILVRAIQDVYGKLKSVKKKSIKSILSQKRVQLSRMRTRGGMGTTVRMEKQNSLILVGEQNNSILPEIKNLKSQTLVSEFTSDLNNLSKEQQNMGIIKEKLNINYAKLKALKRKVMTGGGAYEQQNQEWVKTGAETGDVLTLVRNLVLLFFSLRGYQTKQFFSQDGSKIYCLIFAEENDLKNIAEILKAQKQFNFQFTDILSLEPVDDRFRPLRLNNRLWKPQEYNLSDMFLYLRPQLIDLIQQIDFKRICKEANQSALNSKLFAYGQNDCYEDEVDPTDEQWIIFHKYLVHLHTGISQLRQEYRLDSDIASILNGELEAFDVYVKRHKNKLELQQLSKQNIHDEINKEHLRQVQAIENKKNNILMKYKKHMVLKGIPTTKYVRILQKEQKAYFYMLKFKEALDVANNGTNTLQSFWDRVGMKPTTSFGVFVQQGKNTPLSQKIKFHQIWKKHQTTEDNHISLFSSTEKLKLLYLDLNQKIDVNNFINNKFILQFFCNHDNYELLGLCNNLFSTVSAAPQFYEKKPFYIAETCKISLTKPWDLQCGVLTEYFGEKIGLYFYFAQYLMQMLIPISLIGLVFNLIQWIINDRQNQVYVATTMIFSIIQTQWDNLFTDCWEGKQIEFNLAHGQNHHQQRSIQRSSFKGYHKRSIATDQMNSLEIQYSDLYLRLAIGGFLMVLIIAAYSGVVVALFVFTMSLQDDHQTELNKRFPSISMEVTSAAAINVILLLILDKLYDKISTFLTDFENQKTMDVYETSFIVKKFVLYYFAYVAPLLFIGFLNQPLLLYCYLNNCQLHVEYHFSTLFILIIFSKILLSLKEYFVYSKKKINRYEFRNTLDVYQFVEEQGEKTPFSKSIDRYGIIENYIDHFIFITMLTLFGYTFPLSYLIFFIYVIIKSFTEQELMFYKYQRPWPSNEFSIGIWNQVQQVTSLISLLSNSGSFTVLYSREFGYEVIIVFVAVIIFNCSVKLLIESAFKTTPYYYTQLVKRHSYIIKSTLYQFVGGKKNKAMSKSDQEFKRFPIHKLYGCANRHLAGMFETMSSQDELVDHYQEILIKTKVNQKSRKENQMPNNTEESVLQDPFKEEVRRVVDKPPIELLHLHYNNRITNPIFKLRLKNKKTKQLYNSKSKIFSMYYQIELLNSYRIQWTELRLSQRYFFIRRKCLLIQNFDARKALILFTNQQKMLEHAKMKAQNKFRKHLKGLDLRFREDQIENEKLLSKQENYISKHKWLLSRKVVVFKIKAVWFSGFRRSVQRISSLLIMQEYYKRTKILENMRRDSSIYEKFETLVNYQKLKDYDLDKFVEIFSQLKREAKPLYHLPLSKDTFQPKIYYSEFLKSETFRNLVERFRDTYIFESFNKKLQEVGMQYFEEEIFPRPNINLLKLISHNVWLAQGENMTQCLLQFIQIKKGQQLQFQKPLDLKIGIRYASGKVYSRLANIVDSIDDFYIKGYCGVIYDIPNPISLRQVIKYRQMYGNEYTVYELNQFIYAHLLLFQKQSHGNLQIDSYFLNGQEYYIIDSLEKNDPDLFNLAIIVLQMIYLRPIVDPQKEYDNLKHPLKRLIHDMLFDDPTVEALLVMLSTQSPFKDVVIQQKKDSHLNLNMEFRDYLQITLHKLNALFRLKYYQQALKAIEQFEFVLSSQIYKDSNASAQISFLADITQNLEVHLLNLEKIKQNLSVVLIFYMKYAIHLELRKLYMLDGDQAMITNLMKITKDIRIIMKQLQLNIKIDDLSESQQCIILHRRTLSSSSNTQNMTRRKQLLQSLRKHQSHIKVVDYYQKQIQRYINQFSALRVINYYLKKHFQHAFQILDDIIAQQIQLVGKSKMPKLASSFEDFDHKLYNFNQLSPNQSVVEEEVEETEEAPKTIEDLAEETPSFTYQFLYYKYLQLIIYFDSGNDQFNHFVDEFLNYQIDHPMYRHFKHQIFAIKHRKIDEAYKNIENSCYLGKYIVLNLQKWLNHQQRLIIDQLDQSFLFKQILNYPDLSHTCANRTILWSLIQDERSDLLMLLLKIRSIHQLLHMDHYVPLNRFYSSQTNDFTNINPQFTQNTLIHKLQTYHQLFTVEPESWLHHQSLLDLKVFYLMSISFTYSKKHFENLYIPQETSLQSLANYAISLLLVEQSQYHQIMKNNQIQQLHNDQLVIESDAPLSLQYQIFNSYIYVCQGKSLDLLNYYEHIKPFFQKNLQPSIIILSLIQFYLSCQEFEIVDLLITFSKKLLGSNSNIFSNRHEGFEQDLQVMEILTNQNDMQIIYPYNLLFQRVKGFKHFNDMEFYAQVVLYQSFYSVAYEMNIEHCLFIREQIAGMNHLNCLNSLFTVFQLLQCICQGLPTFELLESVKQTMIKSRTLFEAIFCHLLTRYYLQTNEFELAFENSQTVLNFIQSYFVRKRIYIQNSKKKLYYFNHMGATLIPLLTTTKYIELQDEGQDHQYLHLIDELFVNESILNHLDATINLQQELPPITIIFELLSTLNDEVQQAYLLYIIAHYFNVSSSTDGLQRLQNQLQTQYQDKIKEIESEKQKLKKEQYTLGMLKQLSIDKAEYFKNKINVLNYQLNIYQSFQNGLDERLVLTWSVTAAEKSILQYQQILKRNNLEKHSPYLMKLYLLLNQNFLTLRQIVKAQNSIVLAEDELYHLYERRRHPNRAIFFFKQCLHKRRLFDLFVECVKSMLRIGSFEGGQVFQIAQALLLNEKQLYTIFDQFQHSNSESQLETQLRTYLEYKDERMLQYPPIGEDDAEKLLKDVLSSMSTVQFNGLSELIEAELIFEHFDQYNQFSRATTHLISEITVANALQ